MFDDHAPPIVGVFDHYDQAAEAIKDLWHAGFSEDRIDMVTGTSNVPEQATSEAESDNAAADGAVGGAIGGAVIGAVAGAVSMIFVPALGAVLAGGLLAGALGGGLLGAAGGSYLGPFIALGMSEHEAHHYSRQLEENRVLVIVKDSNRDTDAREILQRNGGRFVPIQNR